MPLRLLEIRLPTEELDAVFEILDKEEIKVIDQWRRTDDDGGLVRTLIDARDAETLSDALLERFGSTDDFRLLSQSVEWTLPAVDEGDDEEEAGKEENQGGDGARWLRRISREELYEDVSNASELTLIYVLTVALSAVVAAVGLIRNDVAVIIGAMVIAPLLGPNIALSLAAALGDAQLAWRSTKAAGAGVLSVAVVSVVIGATLEIDPEATELAARTQATIYDIIVALAAGTAGALAFTTGVSAIVVGVMVAVALLPPLVVAGLVTGAGLFDLAGRALLLVLVNVTCINLAAVAMFFLQRVRPRTYWEAERARKATIIAVATWVLMLALVSALIYFGQVQSEEEAEATNPRDGGQAASGAADAAQAVVGAAVAGPRLSARRT